MTTRGKYVAEKAREAHQQGDLSGAIDLYSQALDAGGLSNQAIAMVHSDRGRAYHQMYEVERALADFNDALLLNPQNPVVHAHRCSLYLIQRRYLEAEQDADTAINLAPKSSYALTARARCHRHQGRIAEALEDYKRVLDSDPLYVPAYLETAALQVLQGRFEEGLRGFRRVMDIDPKRKCDCYKSVAEVYVFMGRYEEAMENARTSRSFAEDPEDLAVGHYLELVAAHLAGKKLDQGKERYENALTHVKFLNKWSPDEIDHWLKSTGLPSSDISFIEDLTAPLREKMRYVSAGGCCRGNPP